MFESASESHRKSLDDFGYGRFVTLFVDLKHSNRKHELTALLVPRAYLFPSRIGYQKHFCFNFVIYYKLHTSDSIGCTTKATVNKTLNLHCRKTSNLLFWAAAFDAPVLTIIHRTTCLRKSQLTRTWKFNAVKSCVSSLFSRSINWSLHVLVQRERGDL